MALAARAALRALPLSAPLLEKDTNKWAAALILPQFRALAPPRFAGTWPNRGGEVVSAASADSATSAAAVSADSAAFFADFADSAALSAAYAAFSAASADSADSAVSADSATYSAARSAASAADSESTSLRTTTARHYWRAVLGDAGVIEQGPLAETVMRRPLWANGTPSDVAVLWLNMKNDLLHLDQNWQVWTDWYEDILRSADDPNSRPLIPDLEYDRVVVPTEEDWEEGPAHVNAILAALEAKYRGSETDISSDSPGVAETEPGETEPSLRESIVLASQVAATVKDGKVHLTQAPPNGEKPVDHSRAAQRAVREQIENVRIAIAEAETSGRNFNKVELLPRLVRYRRALETDDPDYIIVEPAYTPLGADLSDEFLLDAVGSGMAALFTTIVSQHIVVREAVHKVRETEGEERDKAETSVTPTVTDDKLDKEDIEETFNAVQQAVAEGVEDGLLDDTAPDVVAASVGEFYTGTTYQQKRQPDAQERGKRWINSAIVRITGAAITIVGSLTSIAAFAETQIAAALVAKLEPIIAGLLRLFG